VDLLIPVEFLEDGPVPLLLSLVSLGPESALLDLLGDMGLFQLSQLLLVQDALLDQVVLVVKGDVQLLKFLLQLGQVVLG